MTLSLPEPWYRDDDVTFFLGDAQEIVSAMPPGSGSQSPRDSPTQGRDFAQCSGRCPRQEPQQRAGRSAPPVNCGNALMI